MFCPECGKKNEEDALFCGDCGTRLIDNSQQVQSSVAPYIQPDQIQKIFPIAKEREYQQPEPKIKKRVSVAAIILVLQLFFTIGLVVGLIFVINNQNSPKNIAEAYWKATMEQKWAQAYEYCDFPSGEFMSKQMYINAMTTEEEPIEYNAYEIHDLSAQAEEMASTLRGSLGDDFSEDLSTATESSIQKTYYISYVPRGSSDKITDVVTLSKTKEKKFLFWTQWKVTAADCIERDIQVEVPTGAKVTFNEIELSRGWATEEEDSITRYTIPSLFTGQYQVEVTMEDMAPYRMLFHTYEGGIYISHLEPTDEIKEQLAVQLVSDTQEILQAAVEGKDFDEVEDFFQEESIEENKIEEQYKELKDLLGNDENSGVVSYEASDIIVNYEGCDCTKGGMTIQLSAKGNYKESKWRDWVFSTPELKNYDGELSMWITYVNVDGQWKLIDLPMDGYDF